MVYCGGSVDEGDWGRGWGGQCTGVYVELGELVGVLEGYEGGVCAGLG